MNELINEQTTDGFQNLHWTKTQNGHNEKRSFHV